MKIITLASTKGGVGKTTGAVFLAQALAHKGFKTLAIDLDPSTALTDFYLRDETLENLEARSVLNVLTGTKALEDCIFHTELSLSILGATPELMTFPSRLGQDPAGITRLRSRLKKLEGFDVCIIDTPPALGSLLTAGLLAADLVLTPVSPHRWVIQAYSLLTRELDSVEEMTGRKPGFKALFSMVTKGELERLQGLGFDACLASIPKAAPLAKAVDLGQTLNPKAAVFEYFLELANEVFP